MEFRILGPMEVWDGARSLPLPAGRGRALLALLALHPGEVVSAERLIDELWGEHPPATANTVIQGFVSRLRKELEPGRPPGIPAMILRTVGTGYLLAIEPDAVDAQRFQHLLVQARNAAPGTRRALIAEALGLWRGPALAEFVYEPFAQRAITALGELRLVAIEDRIEAELSLGEHRELVAELERLVEAYPFRERVRGLLMLALYRAGRQADALAAYRRARDALLEELGADPGPDLKSLHQAILRHDAALGPRPREITAQRWLPLERRTVTVVYTDLRPMAEPGADPEAVNRYGAQVLDVATEVFRGHGGRVVPILGDSVVAFFGLPVAHEDDPIRAVRAAVELRTAAEAHGRTSQFTSSPKSGIETGVIIVGGADDIAYGSLVTTAARLQQAAADGDVLVGAVTQRLIRGAVVVKPADDIAVNGPGGSVALWRVLDVVREAAALVRRFDTPMRGRQAEVTQLRTLFRRTVRSGAACRVTVLGEAGIGKSRVAEEFVETLGADARVITGRCPAYGEGITFLPLREALLEAAEDGDIPALLEREGVAGADAGSILGAIGLRPQQGRPDELFLAARRMFEVLAVIRPLVVVFDDLHWAEPTLLDLIELVGRSAAAPILLVVLARPELIEDHPEWAATDPRAQLLVLDPLPSEDIEALIEDRAGPTRRVGNVSKIAQTARGNPLFAEQLLAAFDEAEIEVIPAALRGLLAMRLDRLGPAERDILRCVSVVGAESDFDAIEAIAPVEAGPFLDRHLGALERKQLIARTGTSIRFRHVLIEFAAYQSIAREDRARLHERYANWLEGTAQPPPEIDEILGYHLEKAVENRRASGAAAQPALATKAGERLAGASERALGRADMTAAENLLTRARALLPSDHPTHAEVTQRLAETCLVLGLFPRGQELLEELAEYARVVGDIAAERSARLEHARIQFVVGPDPIPLGEIRQRAEQAARLSAAAHDDIGQCRAAFLGGCVKMREGQILAAERAFAESLAFADRSGDPREMLATRWMLAMSIALGPAPVPECINRCQELATARGTEHVGVLTELAMLAAMVGRFDEARELNERARRTFVERWRVRRMLMFVARSTAAVDMLAGQTASAERELREGLEFARGTNELDHISQTAAQLSLLLRYDGRRDEADSLAAVSAQAAPSGGVAAQALSRAATARVASDAGDDVTALRLADHAVRLAPAEMPNLRGDILIQLAIVLRASGHDQRARDAESEAANLHQRKARTITTAHTILDGGY